MKLGFAIVLTLALGALAAHFLLQDNGYVLINFRGYVVEMSVPILVFLLALAYLAIRAVVRIWRAPRRLGELVAERRLRKASERITQGYIEMGRGNYARGEKLLTKGVRNSETPLLNYLAAARAAQAQGDLARRDNWLQMAAEQEPRARATVLVEKAQLQIDSEQFDAARDTLGEALAVSPDNAEALRMLAELDYAAQNWEALEQLLPSVRKHGNVPAETLDEWTVQTWAQRIAAAGGDRARTKALWKQLPKHLRDAAPIVAARVRAMLADGETKKAETALRAALKREWSADLVLIYAEIETGDDAGLLKRVEQWLRDRPEDPDLLLTAARLCVRNELWGKARSYYESSAAIRPAPRTWHELGQLMLKVGEEEAAFSAFEKGLTQTYGDSSLPRLTDATLQSGD